MNQLKLKMLTKMGQIFNQIALYSLHKRQLEKRELAQTIERFTNLKENRGYSSHIMSKGKLYQGSLKDEYKTEHESGTYKKYNWGLDLLKYKQLLSASSIFELGCGSALLREWCSSRNKKYRGLDLINPRNLKEVITGAIDNLDKIHLRDTDLVISSDFLEHLTLVEIRELLPKISGIMNIHCVALYDDNFSHKSVFEGYEWALIFSDYFSKVEILDIRFRGIPFNKKAIYIAAQ